MANETRISVIQLLGSALWGLVFGAAHSLPAMSNKISQRSLDAERNTIPEHVYLIDAYRREVIDQSKVRDELHKLGYSDDNINILLETTRYKPSPPEVAEWARREAFQDDYIQEFGGDVEYPPEMNKLAKMIGADYDPLGNKESLLQYYWRAHWQIPSLQMGFDMYHRGIINDEQLNNLFIAADVMPGWRERLKQLSYNLPTRVDVRRMFRIGVIDADDVYNFYIKLGYSEEDAIALRDFTVIYESEEATNLTKSQILNAFKEAVIDKNTCEQLLEEIGVSEYDRTFLINNAELEIEQTKEKQRIESIRARFRAGIIDTNEMIIELDSLNLPAGQQELLMKKLDDRKLRLRLSPARH